MKILFLKGCIIIFCVRFFVSTVLYFYMYVQVVTVFDLSSVETSCFTCRARRRVFALLLPRTHMLSTYVRHYCFFIGVFLLSIVIFPLSIVGVQLVCQGSPVVVVVRLNESAPLYSRDNIFVRHRCRPITFLLVGTVCAFSKRYLFVFKLRCGMPVSMLPIQTP